MRGVDTAATVTAGALEADETRSGVGVGPATCDDAVPPRPFPLPRTARIAVLASGRGSNLASLLSAFPPASSPTARSDASESNASESDGANGASAPPAAVTLVVTNVPGAPAVARAREVHVDAVEIPWRGREGSRDAFEAATQRALDAHGIDLICLAGFMRILSPAFVTRWAGRIVNVHPSLLPAFRGLNAQRQALEAGATTTGCTIHLVDAGVDTGRILLQRRVPVRPDDDEATLADRILEQEHRAYPEAVRRLLRGAPPQAASAEPATDETS